MDDLPHRLLLHGIDTLQCAYYLYPAGPGKLDFESLRILKEDSVKDVRITEKEVRIRGSYEAIAHAISKMELGTYGRRFLLYPDFMKPSCAPAHKPSTLH